MKGYLLNFYKFSPTNVEDSQNKGDEFIRSIVWSTFDRLEIRDVDKFEQYRLSEFSEKNWIGERQFAMIYELNKSVNLIYDNKNKNDKTNKCKFAFDAVRHNDKMRFFGITLIDFTPEIHNFFYNTKNEAVNPGEEIHRILREAIEKVIEKNDIFQEHITYEIFGILGGQDVVLIWLANQFEDIAKAIEGLRKSKTRDEFSIIANIYTIIGLKDINNKEITYDDIRGELFIKLTKRDTFNSKIFEEDLNEKFSKDERKCCTLFGEHDLMISIKGSQLVSDLYKRDGIFNSKSPNFIKNFIQSKTEIIINNTCDEVCGCILPINTTPSKLKKLSQDMINDYITKIDIIINSDCFTKASYLQETLWLLYEDFLKNIMSSFSYPWTNDLIYQFKNCLDYLGTVVDSSIEKKKKYANIHKLISSMRQMMLHVAQANRIFFEIPNTHLKHTGAYSKILHTYYGVVKEYLKLAYCIPKYDRQSPIIPFISFDVTPIAKSKFCDNIEGFNNKIIRIELPYEALVDITKYIKLLAHEIYHYIAPTDRVERNILVATISLAMIMGQMTKLFFEDIASTFSDFPSNFNNKKMGDSDAFWENAIIEVSKMVQIKVLSIPDLSEKLKIWIDNYIDNAEWVEYFDKFSKAMLDELKEQSGVTQLLWESIQELEEKSCKNNLITRLVTEAHKYSNEDFYKWIYQKCPVDRISSGDIDLRYSLREALPDHFMIQATNMSIEEYIRYVYKYKELVSEEPEHMRQAFRMSLVLNHYLGDDLRKRINFFGRSKDDIYCDVFEFFYKEYKLEDKLCEWIGRNYVIFIFIFDVYIELFEKYFMLLDFKTYNQSTYYPEFFEQFESIKKLLSSTYDDGTNNIQFDNNIRYIERFQNQEEMCSLIKKIRNISPLKRPIYVNDYRKNYESDEKRKVYDEPIPPTVANITELIKAINMAVVDIKSEEEKVPIWFRGQESIEHLLIPSLYRMQNKKNLFYNTSMRLTLRSLIDVFKAKAYNSSEIIGNGNSYDTNCLITMQHYSIPTNILDWTTSAFIAMYFALEKEINNEKNKENQDAVIYLLNPIRLNIAREKLLNNHAKQGEKRELNFPITSLVADDKEFIDYIPMYLKEEKIIEEHIEYPIAVYAPFVNERIKAQLGTFTIFGLDNKAIVMDNEESLGKDYSNFSLVKVQEEYKELCERYRGIIKYKPFLTEVRIKADAKQEIADSLKVFGIGRSNIYPELENISREITKEVKMYFDLNK